MINLIRISLVCFWIRSPIVVYGEEVPAPKPFESSENINVLGSQYLLISLAVSELLGRGVDVDEYIILFRKEGDGHVVMFTDPETTIFQIGSTKKMSNFVVIFNSEGKVTRASFAR